MSCFAFISSDGFASERIFSSIEMASLGGDDKLGHVCFLGVDHELSPGSEEI